MPLYLMETFVFWYPAVMAMMWVFGSLLFYFSNERKTPPALDKFPFVSILMPAHNESTILYPVIEEMTQLNYPNYEIIIINDGSSDDTADVIKDLARKYPIVRAIDLKPNCGKANALYLGTIASKGEIVKHGVRNRVSLVSEAFRCGFLTQPRHRAQHCRSPKWVRQPGCLTHF